MMNFSEGLPVHFDPLYKFSNLLTSSTKFTSGLPITSTVKHFQEFASFTSKGQLFKTIHLKSLNLTLITNKQLTRVKPMRG
jgi:hypothetical protein